MTNRSPVRNRKREAPPTKAYRFDARMNEEQKMLIQRAADFEGRTMTEFVIRSAQEAAKRTLQDRSMLVLNVRATETFVDAILNPAEPGPVLRAAARKYKSIVGE